MREGACFLRQICSTLYSNWILPAELEKLVACVPCRCPTTTHTHTRKKKKGKKQTNKSKPHHAIHFCSIFMTLSCFCIKYKETEKNLIEENSVQKVLKVQWQVTSPRSEKKMTVLCIWNWEENRLQFEPVYFLHVLQILRFVTHCRLKPFPHALSVSKTASVCPLAAFLQKSISANGSVTLCTSYF